MKRIVMLFILISIIAVFQMVTGNQVESIDKKDCFFLSSLHYTTDGQRYWYSKENGGLESLTGVPYDQLACKKCHTSGCDSCHKTESNGLMAYSTVAAQKMDVCLKCHGRARSMMAIDRAAGQQDFHFEQGMQCMDCHTAREVHGDGNRYVSLEQPGAMDTVCENCHDSLEASRSHTVHGEKLDCKACHLRHVVSCTNCHFDTFRKSEKKKSVKVSGWLFLINSRGKVTSANMQNFIIGGRKTFLMFAPHMTHSIMKTGRACNECHGTDIVRNVLDGKIILTWMENGEMKNLKGVIPVAEGVDYQCVYLELKNGKWIQVMNTDPPVYHYPAYGIPLSRDQLRKLVGNSK